MTEAVLGLLGIMTCRKNKEFSITESSFYKHLCTAAPLHNLDVIIFQPDGVPSDGQAVAGLTYRDGDWLSLQSPPPDIVYNRCFYSSQKEKRDAASALMSLPKAVRWSRGLPNKWGVYKILRRSRRASAILPETRLYMGRRCLSNMLAEREYGIFLKPLAGSHGKRTLHVVRQSPHKLRIKGRDGENLPFEHLFVNLEEGLDWIHDFIGSRRYIMQPYLQLTDRRGRPFDVRVLMQKNGRGLWGLTGMAVRQGTHDSITSNLHGGGKALSILPFLDKEYGPSAKYIHKQLVENAYLLPPLLEAACGRLGELGLDFGIDGGGRITLLEVNSKPGRTVFKLTGDYRTELMATENPLCYARHLLLTKRLVPAISGAGSGRPGRMISMVPKEDS